jgi:hypothetical protein
MAISSPEMIFVPNNQKCANQKVGRTKVDVAKTPTSDFTADPVLQGQRWTGARGEEEHALLPTLRSMVAVIAEPAEWSRSRRCEAGGAAVAGRM